MFYRILSRDLKQKRGINFILFLFMILATVFVASSVNNIIAVSNATEYCLDMGKVPDEFISTFEIDGERSLEDWVSKNEEVKSYSKNEAVILSAGNIKEFARKDGAEYKINKSIMLQPQWKTHMLVYDMDKKPVQMEAGEIAMQKSELEENHLSIGDEITFRFGDDAITLRISQAIMDPAFGGDYVGMTRYIVSDSDFERIKESGVSINYGYGVETYDNEEFCRQLNQENFQIVSSIDRDMFGFTYIMSLVVAGMISAVGVCLILIAFLILKFTIDFTLQQDYKEIGIMKAIGIRNVTVQGIYLVKYLVLVGAAALLGCILSIPAGNIMLNLASQDMMMEEAGANIGINVLCSVAVAVFVLLLCCLCTGKLRKYSAIDAIHSGQTGERYRKKALFFLNKRKAMRTPLYLAINDILSNLRRYLVLILTFTIGTVVIILPLNALTTFGSEQMAKAFEMDTECQFFVNHSMEDEDLATSLNKEDVINNMRHLEEVFSQKGYETEISTLMFYALSYYVGERKNSYKILTTAPTGTDGSYIEMLEGTTPILKNEIALSENVMKSMGVAIGDRIHVMLGNKNQEMIITGKYQNYMQMGKSALLSENANVDNLTASGMWYLQCRLKEGSRGTDLSDKELVEQLKQQFSSYSFYDVAGAIDYQMGNTASQISGVKYIFIALICMVNVLITVLMMKIFMQGEKGQIAMMRSIGYSVRTVRSWQTIRIGLIVVLSVILGILFSNVANIIILRPIFGMMGASSMKIAVDVKEAYFIYPGILLSVILAAAYLSSASVGKLNLMEINNAE